MIHFSIYSQNTIDFKRDYIWIFGYFNTASYFGRAILNYNNDSLTITSNPLGLNLFLTNSSISDCNGNLLFYTNGMYVADCTHQVMPHGDSINPGYWFNNFVTGYIMPQGALILPKPGSTSEYFIFHEKYLLGSGEWIAYPSGLYYTKVIMNLNNGLGDVDPEKKNICFISDTVENGLITAVRHANGRDWWILIPKLMYNCYYTILLTPQGLTNVGLQCIGNAHPSFSLGQAAFSPDGSKYVRYGDTMTTAVPNHFDIFSFDRCSGILSDHKSLSRSDANGISGISISPNSRYLYYSNNFHVFQYDLFSSNIDSSEIMVATWDGTVDPVNNLQPALFEMMQMGPNGKIYISAGNTPYLHVIESPDNEGIACNVQQHLIQMPYFNDNSIPNFPNFRLGPLEGSICDSLGIRGRVTYDNSFNVPMDLSRVYLRTISGTIVDSTITDSAGYYRFSYLLPYPTGTYKILTKTSKPWASVNSVDVLLIMKDFVGLTTLTSFRRKAGDVDLNNATNSTDALHLVKRFVGMTTSFPAGDWISEEPTVIINDQSLHVINIKMICTGDVNGSYMGSP